MSKRRADEYERRDDRHRRDHHRDRGSNYRYDKRRRTENPKPASEMPEGTDDILSSLIAQIGEKSRDSLESNLDILSKHILDSISKYKDQILASLAGSIIQLPHKITIYSTLLGLINAKDYDFAQLFLDYITNDLLPTALKEMDFNKSEILVRFLCDCVNSNVILPSSLINLFETFLVVVEEDDSPQIRKDAYVSLVLKVLPWGGREIYSSKEKELASILNTVDEYLSTRNTEFVKPLCVWQDNENVLEQKEFLKIHWEQLLNFQRNNWSDKSILRPYLSFDGELCLALQHTLSPVTVPDYKPEQLTDYPSPVVQFRFLDPHDVSSNEPTLPAVDSIDRFVMEEQVRSIMNVQFINRKECVKSLLAIPCSTRFPMDYIILEVILGEIFRLPAPRTRLIFYFVLLLELSKLPDVGFLSLIALAFEMLYEKLEYMETECRDRFASWFSWHLSNNDFKWHWDDWKECLSDDVSQQFVKEVLMKCVQLSYYERINRTLSEDMQALMPSQPHPRFDFKESGDHGHPAAGIATRLLEAIRRKEPSESVKNIIEELSSDHLTEDDQGTDITDFRVYLCCQSLLQAGSKSYSHCISVLERYIKLLAEVAKAGDGKSQIIYALFSFWEANQQMIHIMMSKFVTYRLINPTTVISCMFSQSVTRNLDQFGVWTILSVTLDKIVTRTENIKKKLNRTKLDAEKWETRKEEEEEEFWNNEKLELSEKVRKTTEIYENICREQKDAFIILFQNLLSLLQEKNALYQPVLDRLRMFLRRYRKDISGFIDALEEIVFTADVDAEILSSFHRTKALF